MALEVILAFPRPSISWSARLSWSFTQLGAMILRGKVSPRCYCFGERHVPCDWYPWSYILNCLSYLYLRVFLFYVGRQSNQRGILSKSILARVQTGTPIPNANLRGPAVMIWETSVLASLIQTSQIQSKLHMHFSITTTTQHELFFWRGKCSLVMIFFYSYNHKTAWCSLYAETVACLRILLIKKEEEKKLSLRMMDLRWSHSHLINDYYHSRLLNAIPRLGSLNYFEIC